MATINAMFPHVNDYPNDDAACFLQCAKETRQLARLCIHDQQEQDAQRYNLRRHEIEYLTHDLVWVWSPIRRRRGLSQKLLRRCFSSYRVLRNALVTSIWRHSSREPTNMTWRTPQGGPSGSPETITQGCPPHSLSTREFLWALLGRCFHSIRNLLKVRASLVLPASMLGLPWILQEPQYATKKQTPWASNVWRCTCTACMIVPMIFGCC